MIIEELNAYYPLNQQIDESHCMYMKVAALPSGYITVKCIIENLHNKKSKLFAHWNTLYTIDDEHVRVSNMVRATHSDLQTVAANLKKALKIIHELR